MSGEGDSAWVVWGLVCRRWGKPSRERGCAQRPVAVGNREKASRAVSALLRLDKIDIKALKRASAGG